MAAHSSVHVLSPVARSGLADEIVARLRDAIHAREFAPGERLVEDAIARSMGVSRGPVREALKQIEREGLVVTYRNRGTFVARLTREDIDEAYSLRQALERLAVCEACRSATPADLAEMQAILDRVAAQDDEATHSPRAASEIDIEFHDILYRASRHKRLIRFWELLRPQIQVFLLSRNQSYANFADIFVPRHQPIVDSIRARDETRAMAVIEEHIRSAYVEMTAIYR